MQTQTENLEQLFHDRPPTVKEALVMSQIANGDFPAQLEIVLLRLKPGVMTRSDLEAMDFGVFSKYVEIAIQKVKVHVNRLNQEKGANNLLNRIYITGAPPPKDDDETIL